MTRDSPLRCLIVDDSPNFLAAAQGLLEQQGVIVVGVVSTGTEALAQVTQSRLDVALVDVDLGAESGFELAERLAVPVILISAHSGQDFADLVAESSAVGFLAKSTLSSAAIHDLLGGAGRVSATPGT
jgi:DNA-binding NarL/FixJ family response regulator